MNSIWLTVITAAIPTIAVIVAQIRYERSVAALIARLALLEKRLDARFDALEQHLTELFTALEQRMNACIDRLRRNTRTSL